VLLRRTEAEGSGRRHDRGLLFNAASQTLVQFGHRNLGGQIGCTMVLHTWDQTLGAHFHVHCIMAAGALAANGTRWIEADPRFLFPVRALSTVFRGKFCEALTRVAQFIAVCRRAKMVAMGTRRPRRGSRLCRRWALQWREDG
jgi:Putative transposase